MTHPDEALRRIQLIAEDNHYAIERVNPFTGEVMARTWSATLEEAAADAKRGTTECYYEIRELSSDKLVRRMNGECVIAPTSQATIDSV